MPTMAMASSGSRIGILIFRYTRLISKTEAVGWRVGKQGRASCIRRKFVRSRRSNKTRDGTDAGNQHTECVSPAPLSNAQNRVCICLTVVGDLVRRKHGSPGLLTMESSLVPKNGVVVGTLRKATCDVNMGTLPITCTVHPSGPFHAGKWRKGCREGAFSLHKLIRPPPTS
jgi:hypothetical protein